MARDQGSCSGPGVQPGRFRGAGAAGRGIGEQMGVAQMGLAVRQREQLRLAVVAQQRSVDRDQ